MALWHEAIQSGCVQAVSMPYGHSPQGSVDYYTNRRLFFPRGEKEPFLK